MNTRGAGGATNSSQPFHNKGVGWKHQPWANKKSENDNNKGFARPSDRQLVNSIEFVNNGASTSAVIGGDNEKKKKIINTVKQRDSRNNA